MNVVVQGRFDGFASLWVRWLQEASHLGRLHVLLWSDDLVEQLTGARPKFPTAERLYSLRSLRCVDQVTVVDEQASADALPSAADRPDIWVVCDRQINDAKRAWCAAQGIELRHITDADLAGFPEWPVQPPSAQAPPAQRKVLVTGCYDWFHSGHVRFFEEAAEHGELYVVVGHDANVRLLKGEGHPMFPEAERRYLAGAVRYVHQALVSTGHGWMDAEPEIKRLGIDIYLVNEDGDKPEKRAFADEHGLNYVVLRRLPKAGLPARQSTDLRGY
ncbi:MAG: adenylyltransferase/cytidyltransferase family protein [Armatimonadetes bacterium]|nr:adenylyltransferase/cytidyltransferase family protein [Armatimonadota bacterium]